MTVDQVFIIKKLQNLDEMLVAYSAVTRMPFAICDDESFNDQVWIFTDQDKLKTFAEKYKEEKKLILADKLSNLRAICRDYVLYGDELWERFNAGPEKQAWYYGAMTDALKALGDDKSARDLYWEFVSLYKDIRKKCTSD